MKSALLALACAAMLASGCARHVTLPQNSVSNMHDRSWRLRGTPQTTEAPTKDGGGDGPRRAAVVPFRKRPSIQEALRSPVDDLGIPVGLDAADPLLAAHRLELRARTSARRYAGAAMIAFGVASGALSVLLLWSATHLDEKAAAQGPSLAISGFSLAIIGVAEIGAGSVMAMTSPDRTALETYFRDTYGGP